jgi:hypothetical protein
MQFAAGGPFNKAAYKIIEHLLFAREAANPWVDRGISTIKNNKIMLLQQVHVSSYCYRVCRLRAGISLIFYLLVREILPTFIL